VDTDLTRPDGIIQCREITLAELLQLSWKLARVLRYLRDIPIGFVP
jgi:hypothetical protein